MKITINKEQFHDLFKKYRRENNFSPRGLDALFEWLEDYEDACGCSWDMDVIGICCDFCEYDNLKEFQSYYGQEYESIEDIEYKTTVIPISGTDGFIIHVF